ncbi:hypothetical protein [Legionella drancourtii]|uniref:Uncharacterized protein n=1 Tax=Legionella drancourtii LLAP12 TaxID=658187 RepID=G9ELW3_9GAMM|nr:hypothetical protein [Legionella drancourtii]EHL31563.1 hypothetical protein LDG_6223 [Legionella drancourtii LLAP12]
MNCWDELDKLRKMRESLLDREIEILDEWQRTEREEEKIKLEEEYQNLPFTEVQEDIIRIINQCFNKNT